MTKRKSMPKFTGDLGKPMPRRPSIYESEKLQQWEAELQRRSVLLAEALNIPPETLHLDSPSFWKELALTLAGLYVPGFRQKTRRFTLIKDKVFDNQKKLLELVDEIRRSNKDLSGERSAELAIKKWGKDCPYKTIRNARKALRGAEIDRENERKIDKYLTKLQTHRQGDKGWEPL